ncbi:MAG: rRNA pseudouridine synthase [Bacteroides sp.]|nr:rRNA pseudouridine synthase [Prevotella sp.]MCM1407214.1 rRNA pseudouridine synthase [Treponema brennaborense]MCM1470366.1 rRNA pseudouridine synthase [Bacteroides sp.]
MNKATAEQSAAPKTDAAVSLPKKPNRSERLDKLLAHHGFGTRKDVKKLLHAGCVTVNGTVCRCPDAHVFPQTDIVCVDGKTVEIRTFVYIMMNKCAGTVCSAKAGDYPTVFDLLPEQYGALFFGGHLHTVGRLDADTEGLLLLTNDGALTHRLTSPKTHVPKTYTVKLTVPVPHAVGKQYTSVCRRGFYVPADGSEEGFSAAPAVLEWQKIGGTDDASDSAVLTITEGKYHQVKRMFRELAAVCFCGSRESALSGGKTGIPEVAYLKRTAVGSLRLDETLPTGQCRELTDAEYALLSSDASVCGKL